MPKKQRGGSEVGSGVNEVNTGGGIMDKITNFFGGKSEQSDQPIQPAPNSDKISTVAKDVVHTSILTAMKSALAAVRAGKGVAEGAAVSTEKTGYQLSSETIKQAGVVGEQAILTAGDIATAELKGLSKGGAELAEKITQHALLAVKEVGVGGLESAESVGEALQSPEFQEQVKDSAKTVLVAAGYGVKDVGLIVELVTKGLAKGLTAAVASLSGGRRKRRGRSGRKTRRHRLKRRATRHR
jgi:hypothetical protein